MGNSEYDIKIAYDKFDKRSIEDVDITKLFSKSVCYELKEKELNTLKNIRSINQLRAAFLLTTDPEPKQCTFIEVGLTTIIAYFREHKF